MHATGTSHSPYAGPSPAAVGMLRRTVLWGGLALLAGCAGDKPPVVTQLTLDVAAAADLNPDARGRASPLTVRVYALKTPGPFQTADFFSLYDKDTATLGAELVKREEFQLAPGQKKSLQFTLPPEAKSVAVMAAYRDLERARWRDLKPLDVGKPNTFKLELGARQVSLNP
ncbi:type VI secretion system lipoprotein TssJ [Variovorax dokdonensis]|uniref:Type VI secretion system lipoprotein TssJ n=1 Tax=Variovorax dokdonensis TaxID=344883 RepID=A0ABT7NAL4_9BURK|nr:type VI secretion system lipoprotein TssJ [Variovorax dokdonensis]MDM0044978.1 type VI secretion system lipoprotein TssJ [Variovorax dokdonensis]